MPRMSGIDVARTIRSGNRNAQVPIIFLTAMDTSSAQILDGYAVGAVDYLCRPLEPAILKSKVSIFVELYMRREQAKWESAERVRLEAERAAAERASHEKDMFLSALSHELRTPLTSILLWSDMLLHKELAPDVVRRGLETIDVCARHEVHTVENVLEMSRVVTGTLSLDMTLLDVGEVIADAVAEIAGLAAERQVRIAYGGEGGGVQGLVDRLRLRQVLHNLLENAVNFTPADGRVDVTLSGGASAITIQIRDTGIGFSPDAAPRLFLPFTQGPPPDPSRVRGGLGLGLALAKELIEMHGGAIAAASRGIGQGASFTVTLPRAAADIPGGRPPELH
jgi:signal transduction histidine kinase